MRCCAVATKASIWAVAGVFLCLASAQISSEGAEPERNLPSSVTAASVPSPPTVREVGPKLYYLKDRDGKLVPVPDIPFERYEQFLAEEIGGGGLKPPRYSFADLVELKGRADENQAEVDAVFPLRFTPSGEGEAAWVRIPLRLNQGIPIAAPKLTGSGEVLLEYDSNDGYVAWVRSAEANPSLTLRLKFPVSRTNGDSRLAISAARTPTRLQLELPTAAIEGRLLHSEEQILGVSHPGENRTLFVVDGTGGELGLSWSETSEAASMLEATGAVLLAVNGGRMQCDARLKVHSYGTPIDSFLVRLPPLMELNAFNPPGFRLSVVSSTDESLAAGQQILVKRLDGKTTDPLEVRLVAWRPPQLGFPRTPLEVGGFEVIGAVRQWGSFEVAVDGEWQCDFVTGKHVQRVEEVSDASRQQNVVARFDYFRQPYSLKLQLVPKQFRLNVEPVLIYRVEPQRVRLEARLRYKMSGPRPSDVKIDFGSWTVDRVTPSELLSEPVAFDSLTPLRVPLSSQALGTGGDFELRVEAHRELSDDQKLVLGPIRCPEAVAAPALVVIVGADNTEVVPEMSSLVGLIPDRLPASLSLVTQQPTPLVYREEPTTEGSVFVGSVRKREQAVLVQIDTRVSAEEQHLAVEQSYEYQVSYEPLSELVFESPTGGAAWEDLRITVEGQDAEWIRDEELDPRGGVAARIRVPLPKPGIGRCEAIIRYKVPLRGMQLHSYKSVELPLLQPINQAGSIVIRNALRLDAADNVVVDLQDDQWTVDMDVPERASVGSTEGSSGQFLGEGRRNTATLSAALVPRRSRQTITLHRAWLQVWLANDERRDRAVFQLSTDQNQLDVQLPPFTQTGSVQVWLAGKEHTDFTVLDDRRVRIGLSKEQGERSLTVELFYWFTILDPPIGRLTVEPPTVIGATRAQRFYWQLVMPRSEYLLWSPESLIREVTWRWQGIFFGRETHLGQTELEDWLQASHQQSLPPETNQYLFSTLGSASRRVFFSAKRQVIVLGFSGAVLAVGLLLIYVPRLRNPGLFTAGAIALAAFGAMYPDPAILAAQAAAVGIALVPLARLLEWTVSNRRVQRMAGRATVYGKPDSKVTDLAVRPGEGSSQTGTVPHIRMTAAEPQL